MDAAPRCAVCDRPLAPYREHWCSDGCRDRDVAAAVALLSILTDLALERMARPAAEPHAA